MLDAITKQYEKELSMIKKAPFACFLTAAVLAAIFIYVFHFSMVTVSSMKDDLIKEQDRQITQLKAGKPVETNANDQAANTNPSLLKVIENKKFINEKVLLDGYKYVNCSFENVTLIYNGGLTAMVGGKATVGQLMRFETNSTSVKQIIKIMHGLSVLAPEAFKEQLTH